jgi:nitrous oxidase accessory protein
MRSFLATGVLGLLAILLATGGQGAAAAPSISLQEQIDRAQPGDTLAIEGGVYNERIVIDKPLILEGRDWPVIDGGGEGDVVTIKAEKVTVSRFVIRNSGRAVSQEPAAVKILEAHEPTIQYNRIQKSHFGIHATGSHHGTFAYNEIDVGNDVPQERRGHAIYLWEVESSAVHGNTITNSADGIHLEFSDDNGIGENTVTNSRYALHFMTAHNNRILNNSFRHNLSGALLMFSHDILVKGNEFSNNRKGASGAGMLIKDVDNLFVEGNSIQRNKYGITVEGTPNTAGASATFMSNTLALNDTGIGLFSNAPITFVGNAMIENTVQVEAISGALGLGAEHGGAPASTTPETPAGTGGHNQHTGQAGETAAPAPQPAGGLPTGPAWALGGRGNYWSDYRGYDADGDDIGDRPYILEPSFAGAMDDHPTLRFFQFTLAQQGIEMATDMFPVYEYDPVMIDPGPLMTPPGPALPRDDGVNTGLIITSVLLLLLAAAVLQTVTDFDPIGALLRGGRRIGGNLNRGAA